MAGDRTFRLGYSSITWGPTPDLDLMLGTIADAGWEGIEFLGTSPEWLGTPRRLRGMIDRHGLEPVAMFGTLSLGPDADLVLERQRRAIEYAAELGCLVFGLLGGQRVDCRLPTEDEFRRLADQAERLIDHAAPHGLTLAYHAHPRCTVESEAEQDRLLAHAERLQVCVDVSVAILEEEDPIAQLRKYRDRLAYVHMKDWARGKFCLMGEGTRGLDFRAVRETLNALDYRGWVVGELSPYADYDAAEACRANMTYLRSIGY